jgi:4-amino-4-deoxy-L-arabinose transferase-like glycosyltransferase
VYVLLSTDPYLYGNTAQLEQPINLFATAALAFLVRSLDSVRPGRRAGWCLAAGVALGLASLVKQVAGLPLLLFLGYAGMQAGSRTSGRGRLAGGLALLAGTGVPWCVALVVLALQGALPAAIADIVVYGGALAADTPADPGSPPFLLRWVTGNADPAGRLPWPFGATDYLVWWGTGSWPAWVAGVPGVAWLLVRRSGQPAARLTGLWTLAAWVQVAMPGLFWAHYYLLPTPGLAIAVGVLAGEALAGVRGARAGRRLVSAGIVVGLLGAIGALGVLQTRDYLLVPSTELTVRYKGGRQWVSLRQLGRELRARTAAWRPDERTLLVWGWQSPLYFYGELDGVTPQLFVDPLMKAYAAEGTHAAVRPRLEHLMADIEARPPALVFAGDPPFPGLAALIRERYTGTSQMPALPDGRGLWILPQRREAFEASGP